MILTDKWYNTKKRNNQTYTSMAASRFARFDSYALWQAKWALWNTAKEQSPIPDTSIDSSTICFVKNGDKNTILLNGEEYPSLDLLAKLEGIDYILNPDGTWKSWIDHAWSKAIDQIGVQVTNDYITRNAWVNNNNCFGIHWSGADTSKKATIVGSESAYTTFRNMMRNNTQPCEVAKSSIQIINSDVPNNSPIYYVNESAIIDLDKTDLTKTAAGADSHNSIQIEGHNDYLQMVKIPQLYVGFMVEGDMPTQTYEVWFYVGNQAAPAGMSPWFLKETIQVSEVDNTDTISKIDSAGSYKLFCRYNSLSSDTAAGGTAICSCSGSNQASGTWSANALHTANVNTKVYEITYWEYIIMCYVFIAYFAKGVSGTESNAASSFNIENYYHGLESGSEAAARATGDYSSTYNGCLDTVAAANNGIGPKNTANAPYVFLWIENALHAKQYIWTAGCSNMQTEIDEYFDSSYAHLDSSSGATWKSMRSYLTYAPNKANSYVHSTTVYDKIFHFNGLVSNSGWNGYISQIDIYGYPKRTGSGAGASAGYYDQWYTNATASTVMYVGGPSNSGSYNGLFCRSFHATAAHAYWYLRGFATLDVKSGS